MRIRPIGTAASCLLIGVLTAVAFSPRAHAQLTDDEATRIGVEAYIYGYPLVTMEKTRQVMTNVAETTGFRAPMEHIVLMRHYPDAKFRDVTAPNADTLYSTAWIDVSKEPYVLSLPDEGDRFFLMPLLSGWTDVFAVPGKRTTGPKARDFVITGPGWKGKLPERLEELKSPTAMVWLLGRTYCTGTPEDYAACHAVMDKYRLVPLSAWGKDYTPPPGKVDPSVDMKTPVRDQVHGLDAVSFFELFAKLLKTNPPAAADAPMIARLAKIGIEPGKDFDPSKLPAAAARAIPQTAQKKILAQLNESGTHKNGWNVMTSTGLYGTNYLQRAFVTAIGLGANRPQDAVYPTSEVDGEGRPYDGANRYVMHFSKGQAPPVNGFWSLTMYDAHYFFVENPLDKYTVSPRNDLKYNADGSLDLFVQHESPGKDKEANWLPAPAGKFVLMLRMYWPKDTPPSVIDGSWLPPAVKRVP